MASRDLVRPSRDGDQFHYHWAARRCLELLSTTTELVAVSIEGSSSAEADGDEADAGEDIIDVALYFGAENPDQARLVRYVQLKHSTRRAQEPWTASGLEKTIRGFAERYEQLLAKYSADDASPRFRFEFTTNRPLAEKVREALADLAAGNAASHPMLHKTFIGYTGLDENRAAQFFQQFSVEPGEPDLWEQRNLLSHELGSYLPDADGDAPVQLKELVTRKATTEFKSDPTIRRHDVLRVLRVSEEQLLPAPCSIRTVERSLAREQEAEILQTILSTRVPVIIHADGGVGKSVLVARLAASIPGHSTAVLYDCFGSGLYRSAMNFRHRHRDALVQIANELSVQGLCHPLIPSAHADASQYMRAFVFRLSQVMRVLRAKNSDAVLCLIVDAADNAQMAADEHQHPASFVRDLIRTPMPDGVRLVVTCRTHRREMLVPPPDALEILLRPFSEAETGLHLRSVYPSATDSEVAEFAYFSSSNPRVQALVLGQHRSLAETLKALGPTPTTVSDAIGELLEKAIAQLRDQAGGSEKEQVELICQGLAVLRPLVPVAVLAKLSQTSESAVRSFVFDFGRPLMLKGNSIHFADEPVETWFREKFRPDADCMARFLSRLRPLVDGSTYAAAVLPQLLLQAGRLDELVDLALSEEGLPSSNPMARRDVELERMTFALKACLQQRRYLAATKLALKAAGETAGEQRQIRLIQDNTDVAAILMEPDRIEDIVTRRVFAADWMGSGHAYNAGLMSGRTEYGAEASSQLRMAMDWLRSWARRSEDKHRREEVSDQDRAEMTMAFLRLKSPRAAAEYLRGWSWRPLSFEAGRKLGARLVDLGQHDQLDTLAVAAGNDVWLILGLVSEASTVMHSLSARPLERLLRLLSDRRVKLEESNSWSNEWKVLYAVCSAVEIALRALPHDHNAWSALLRRYLPTTPPRLLVDRYGADRIPMLRAYALEAALRGQKLTAIDIAPSEVRKQLESDKQYGRSRETVTFLREVGGLLPWCVLSAEIACGRTPVDLAEAIQAARKETAAAESREYSEDRSLRQAMAREWLRILAQTGAAGVPQYQEFESWLATLKDPLWPQTLVSLCRFAARCTGMSALALNLAVRTFEILEPSREDAESRSASYMSLARAILVVSQEEAKAYFDRGFEISSRIGDENLERCTSLLHLAKRAGSREQPRARTAYRLSRVTELAYTYVARDKHFDWKGTVEALVKLCPASAITILSRWRDRRFGDPERLLPEAVYNLIESGQLPAMTPIAMAGLTGWKRVEDLKRALSQESDAVRRFSVSQIAYRYLRVIPELNGWSELAELAPVYAIDFADLDRLIAFEGARKAAKTDEREGVSYSREGPERRDPDWNEIFENVDFGISESLRMAYARLRTFDPPYQYDVFYREALSRVGFGREQVLIRAVSDSAEFGIFELRNLLDALPKTGPLPVSVRNAVRDAVLAACRREPHRVQRNGWYSLIPFEELDDAGIVSDEQVVRAMLEGFVEQVEQLGASELFMLVEPLTDHLTADEADESLNFGLDLLANVLRPEDGDGEWRAHLQPPQTVTAALAGYIWAGLGSPVVAERWEFAHVVRSIVELGWGDLLRELVVRAEAADAHPFVDTGFEFYIWHARQWFLIGLARGVIENAHASRDVVPLLRHWLCLEHVLIRDLSVRILRILMAAGVCDDCSVDLESANRPSLPEHVYENWWGGKADDAETQPEAEVPDDEKFYFGIDIVPYWFAPLGRAFGLSERAIERRARRLLRQHMHWAGGGWRNDARHTRRLFNERETSHSHGSMPKADDLTAYHGYHALMFVAAELLQTNKVGRRDDTAQNDFEEWFSGYRLTRPDDRWLADRRDPRLVADTSLSGKSNRDIWRWSVTAPYMDKMLKTDDGLAVLWGDWSEGSNDYREEVSVRSALVCSSGAEALMAALQTAAELDRFKLPAFGGEGEEELRTIGTLKLTGWVAAEHISAQLDEHDPWGEDLRYPGPLPSADVIAALSIKGSMDGRTWSAGNGDCLRSETWTLSQGYGDEAETVPGTRLSANQEFLRLLHEAYPKDRLVVSVSIRRWLSRRERDDDEPNSYLTPYVRYYLMGADSDAQSF